jgi:anti-sigma B factor antagonist
LEVEVELAIEKAAGGAVVFRLDGRLDLVSAGETKACMVDTVKSGQRRLVVDMSNVDFVDSSGLGAIIGVLKAARQAGGDLRLARPTSQLISILELTMLNRVLRPYETVEEALAGYE